MLRAIRWSCRASSFVSTSWARSPSRTCRRYCLRHRSETASVPARHDGGSPPRSQSCIVFPPLTSPIPNPAMSMELMRPASDSPAVRRRGGATLPVSTKRVWFPGRSAKTRSTGINSGIRWASSITTIPRISPRTACGYSRRRASSTISSRSKNCPAGAPRRRARCDFPHCRGPSTKVTAHSRREASTADLSACRMMVG